MLVSEWTKMKWNQKNKDWYESKGYLFTGYKEEFDVKIIDLSPSSRQPILCYCDYCLKDGIKTVVKKQYRDYIDGREIVKKDACKKCRYEKVRETNIIKYGVERPQGLKSVKEKMKQTNLERYGNEYFLQSDTGIQKTKEYYINEYGVEHYTQTEEWKEKFKETSLQNWGTDHPFKNKELRKKVENTIKEKYGVDNVMKVESVVAKLKNTLYGNDTAPCSSQQKYIHSIIKGELNYPIGYYSLDIAFPEDQLYVEYDGGGHWLSIALGSETEEEFKNRNRKRDYYLNSKGWKEIRIISRKDLIPSDNIIIEMIEYAKEIINSGRSWVHFDIDNNKITTSKFERFYDFGKLRKVTNNNIKQNEVVAI